MSITFEEVKTPSQMLEKDYTRLASKLKFIHTMHRFWPCCLNCGFAWGGGFDGCPHKRACVGYMLEIDRKNNHPIVRWRRSKIGICKYYKEENK